MSGHQTSVALEPEFWEAIDELAKSKGLTWSRLVSQIDADRVRANLASTLRVTALEYYRELAERTTPVPLPETVL